MLLQATKLRKQYCQFNKQSWQDCEREKERERNSKGESKAFSLDQIRQRLKRQKKKKKTERRKNAEGDTTRQKRLGSTRDSETYAQTLRTIKRTTGQDEGKDRTQITKVHVQ